MQLIATEWTSRGTQLQLRCWCGGQFSHGFCGRQDRLVTCPRCGYQSDLRVIAEMAAVHPSNDAATLKAA